MIAARLRWRLARSQRDRLAGSLRQVGNRLEGLARCTEQDFLAVGGKLEDITKSARAEAETLASLDGDMGGDRGSALAAALDEVLAWAKGARQVAGSNALFRGLTLAVEAVSAPLQDLKKAVRTLRVMGVVAGIESARLGERAAEFAALAGEVGGLAAAIDRESNAMLETSRGVFRLLDQTCLRAAALERKQASELLSTAARGAEGLAVLRAGQKRIGGVSRDAQSGYRRVAAVIGEIVQALQFHDATRQRIEHVVAELAHVADGLDSRTAGDRESVSARTVELQAAQLGEAAQSFLECIGKIRDDLTQLAGTVAEFACLARGLQGGADQACGSMAGGVSACYAAVGTAIAAWTASRRALADAAAAVGEACTRMSVFIAQIEGVGVRLLWLALNAEVQAVRLAGSGAVMGAVAEGIRGVAQHASLNANLLSLSLRDVKERAARLAAEFGGDGEASSQDADTVAARVRQVEADLRTWGAESDRLARAIATGGDALAHEIAALAEGITAHEAMADVSSACLVV